MSDSVALPPPATPLVSATQSPPASHTAANTLEAIREDAPAVALTRFTVPQYYDVISLGFWDARAPELVEGLLVDRMPPPNPPHRFATNLLLSLFQAIVPDGWHVCKEDGLELPGSVLIPDLAIVRGSIFDYRDRNPTPADVALLVEVADSSLQKDHRKAALYAAAGVPEFLLVDLAAKTLTLHRQPSGEGYQHIKPLDEVPVTIDGQIAGTITRADVFAEDDQKSRDASE